MEYIYIYILALHSKTVARDYSLKWKPQMLHLVVDQSSKMGAVFDLTEVQRLGGRKFVLVGQLQSDVWTDPATKKIVKMCRNKQVIVDQVGGRGKDTCSYERRDTCRCCKMQG